MLKKIALYIILATVASGFIACNEDSDDPTVSSSNVMVTSFNLKANDSLLVNLDSPGHRAYRKIRPGAGRGPHHRRWFPGRFDQNPQWVSEQAALY